MALSVYHWHDGIKKHSASHGEISPGGGVQAISLAKLLKI